MHRGDDIVGDGVNIAARVEPARQHLVSSELPIGVVADKSGFRDPEQMRRAFLRQLGVNPHDYRERFSSHHERGSETRMMVPSVIAYSKSWSPDNSLKSSSNTPFYAHRRKRLKAEFQLPNVSGRSRQGAPARAIQHRLQKPPVVRRRAARITRLARQERRHPLPLRVAQNQPNQCRLLSRQP